MRIAILGGGTAGWMAACLFARAWPDARLTVVESPEIGIVGVGEGSTPQLRALFATLGIAEDAWMAACDATYKTGIEFRGWSDAPGHVRYFHPFTSAVDLHTQPAFHYNALARRTGHDVDAHPDRFFLNAALAAGRRAPIAPDTFPFRVDYGYHFDAHRVGEVLRAHAVSRGVVHRSSRIDRVAIGEDGPVAHLCTEDGETIAADLFVDASGFRAVIAQEALGVPFLPFADNLFCDRAVVMPTPADPSRIPSHTVATALTNGWAWAIPLTARTGNGYVYASRYCDADAAEAELRAHLGVSEAGAARHLTMKVGRLARSWSGNCLAIGLAQGFIEPLEATALHICQATIEGFIDAWNDGGGTAMHRDRFNAAIGRRYDGIRDYIVAHYRLNRRTDSPFWRDNAANAALSDSLKAIMTCWFTGGDVSAEIDRQGVADCYSALSWECLMAGYGTFPDPARLHPAADRVGLPKIDRMIAGCALNFPDHAETLAARRR